MGWRDTKSNARAVVHDTMKVPAILLASLAQAQSSNSEANLGQFNVRVHEKQTLLGDQAGTSLNSAEMAEPIPKLIFWRADLVAAGVTLRRNMVVSVSAGEAYNLDLIKPHDQETITCEVTRLDAADSASLPLPEEDDG